MDIAHLAPGFYSTPGLVFDVFHEITFFLENSHFLVSPLTQHAVPVGTQYRLVLCGAPPSPASVVVLWSVNACFVSQILNMCGDFSRVRVLESEGLIWVSKSLGTRFVSLKVTHAHTEFSLPASFWNPDHNGGGSEYSRAWRLWFWVYKCSSRWFWMPCVSVNNERSHTDRRMWPQIL